MGIIDFHIHAGVFKLLRDDIQELITKRPMEPGVKVEEVFSEPVRLEKYLRDNKVERAIIVAECGPGTNFSIDSELIAGFCSGRPMFIPFGSLNPNFHDVPAELEKSLALGMRGFKLYPADHGFDPLLPQMMPVYDQCEQRRLPVMFHTGLTAQRDAQERYIAPRDFLPIIEGHPDLMVILAHAGKPHWYDEAAAYATRYPNVYLDTALIDPEAIASGPLAAESVWSKLLFGSDWPVCGGYSTLQERMSAALAPDVHRAVFTDNPLRLIERIGN
jgi:predicted TIM-barrel fold metal-dependent hydrolase